METWSSTPQTFSADVLNYDFTTSSNKAFGNNLKLVGSKWCIYSGDVNQDGFINISDQNQVFIDNLIGAMGFLVTDLNGDFFVEVGDLNNVFINKVLGISRQKPAVSLIQVVD